MLFGGARIPEEIVKKMKLNFVNVSSSTNNLV